MKGSNNLKILLIEDSPFEARVISDKIRLHSHENIVITHVTTLEKGIACINSGKYDVIIMDLILKDAQGYTTFSKIKEQTKEVPFILLTGLIDEDIAVKAVQEGAQDYLVKSQVSGELLIRSIRYAIERHRVLTELRNRSLIDDLTGLYNRRGFFTFAEREIKLTDRNKKGFVLIYADLDYLKYINDNLGHQIGDKAIIATADILRDVFREADIIARIGGDEFIILAVGAAEDSIEPIRKRVNERVKDYNQSANNTFDLSISMGMAIYDQERPCTIDELLNKADKMMYEEKGKKTLTR